MPDEFINSAGNYVTDKFIEYALPLIGGPLPEFGVIENIGDNWFGRIMWGTAYSLFYIQFATSWWMFLLLPIHFLMGPIHGAIINWCAHKWGYINFKVNDTAKNLFPFDFLMCSS